MDAEPQEFVLVVAFENKEAYQANATRPDQHGRHQAYRALLETDPEWHDGEIMFSHSAQAAN